PLALTSHDWQTPLGVAAIDKDLHDSLSKPPLEEDILAHRDEHSIEVQLPFLQHLSDRVRFVPICMAFQEYELATEVGELVAGTRSWPWDTAPSRSIAEPSPSRSSSGIPAAPLPSGMRPYTAPRRDGRSAPRRSVSGRGSVAS